MPISKEGKAIELFEEMNPADFKPVFKKMPSNKVIQIGGFNFVHWYSYFYT